MDVYTTSSSKEKRHRDGEHPSLWRLPFRSVPLALHAVTAVVVLFAVAAHRFAPDLYERSMQEDRFIEWLTVTIFFSAAVILMPRAIRERRWFDFLVALFCLFVAGEEMSWGQRLLGYTPPSIFLEHNTQQEANLHNFSGVLGRPKWSLITALGGFGILLPLIARWKKGFAFLSQVGATPPRGALVPWFALAITLLIWYPLQYTGEWVELMSAFLFLGTAASGSSFYVAVVAGVLGALGLTFASGARAGGPPSIECAKAEVLAVLRDMESGAATVDLLAGPRIEKRVWTVITDGLIDHASLASLRAVSCDASIPATRRRYLVDPWGNSYWVSVRPDSTGLADIEVRSLGPNRRRDGSAVQRADDIIAIRRIDPLGSN